MTTKYEDEGEPRSWEPTERRSKRIKLSHPQPARESTKPPKAKASEKDDIFITSLVDTPLLQCEDFEAILPKEAYLAARLKYLKDSSERDPFNNQVRSLTLSETHELEKWLEGSVAAGRQTWTSGELILTRRLELQKVELNKSESAVFSYDALRSLPARSQAIAPLPPSPSHSAPNIETLNALYAIKKTPYTSSFTSRLIGSLETPGLIHRDWETETVWLQMLTDIKLHHSLSHIAVIGPGPPDCTAPIDYVSLQHWHLPQLHDLLTRIFWPGIDVSDSLNYSPEKCTVVAVYKRLVIGAAFLSSPEETYLTYLVVRPGWELANIAGMLYFIITANPKRDITLHVSANNSAMLLYNKFGFKAEEFIVGFYDDYLPKESKACKNAFRLRLRR